MLCATAALIADAHPEAPIIFTIAVIWIALYLCGGLDQKIFVWVMERIFGAEPHNRDELNRVKAEYRAKVAALNMAGLDRSELRNALQKAKQDYLRALAEVLK